MLLVQLPTINKISTGVKFHQELGFKHIVLHKENLYASEGYIKQFKIGMKNREKFKGSHVFVHNDIVKKIWIECNLIKKSDISVGGCMRMDDFIHNKKKLKKNLT